MNARRRPSEHVTQDGLSNSISTITTHAHYYKFMDFASMFTTGSVDPVQEFQIESLLFIARVAKAELGQ